MNHNTKLAIFAITVAATGSCNPVECANGTEEVFDKMSNRTICQANPSKVGVQCDSATAKVSAGVCVGNPTKFPTCGAGTRLDPATNTCVSTGGSSKTCDPNQASGKFCIQGSIRYIKDETSTRGRSLVVRAYDPLKFLADPTDPSAEIAPPQTTDDGSYAFNGLADPGAMLVAIGVQDAAKTDYILSGSGVNNVKAGNIYTVDIYAIEKTLVTSWETQAGVTGMVATKGAYLARYLDKVDELQANRAAGVTITVGGSKGPNQYFFKDGPLTIDKNAVATDGTGMALQIVIDSNPTTFTGAGGPCGTMITWETTLGTSAPGVVFFQKFHPMP